jgi:hypothetical protein
MVATAKTMEAKARMPDRRDANSNLEHRQQQGCNQQLRQSINQQLQVLQKQIYPFNVIKVYFDTYCIFTTR